MARTQSESAKPPKRPVTPGELAAHVKWRETDGREGVPLDLRERSLRKMMFPANANLREANLAGADLRHADLTDAKLWDVTPRNADLRDAAEGLLEEQLSGADLCRAKLLGALRSMAWRTSRS